MVLDWRPSLEARGRSPRVPRSASAPRRLHGGHLANEPRRGNGPGRLTRLDGGGRGQWGRSTRAGPGAGGEGVRGGGGAPARLDEDKVDAGEPRRYVKATSNRSCNI